MKILKPFIYLSILIAFLSLSSEPYAQNTDKKFNKTPEEIAKKRTDRINEIVSLTTTQYDQIYGLFVSHVTLAKEKRQQFGTDKKGFRDAMKESRKNLHQQVRSVLTEEQAAKLKQHKEQMREKRQHRKKNKQDSGDAPKSY